MVAQTSTWEHNFGFILSDISRLARKEFDRRVRELGVTRAQWLVLLHVARRPGCTQTDLADAMQMQKITVSRHVHRLVRAGWMARHDQADDARAYHLHLSSKAAPIISRLSGGVHNFDGPRLPPASAALAAVEDDCQSIISVGFGM